MTKYLAIAVVYMFLLATESFGASELKKTVKLSGGDYTSLEACLDANEQNLVSNDRYLSIEIDGDWSSPDTTPVTVHNYICDETHYIRVYTTGNAHHNGTSSAGYKLASYISAENITIQDNSSPLWITFEGFVILVSSVGGNIGIYLKYVPPDNQITIRNLVINGRGYSNAGICTEDADSKVNIYNNFIIRCMLGYYGGMILSGITIRAYNNTIYGCDCGIKASDSVLAVNNACFGNSIHGDFLGTVNFSTSSRYNLSSDGTADDGNLSSSGTGIVNRTIDGTNDVGSLVAGSEDLHIKTTADMYNSGTDIYGDAVLPVTSDIDYDSLSARNDIGADEYALQAGPSIIPSRIIIIDQD